MGLKWSTATVWNDRVTGLIFIMRSSMAVYFTFVFIGDLTPRGGGRAVIPLFPVMAYTKGAPFQASGIKKGRDLTNWGIWNKRDLCHFSL